MDPDSPTPGLIAAAVFFALVVALLAHAALSIP
jgi:hypothetical protein